MPITLNIDEREVFDDRTQQFLIEPSGTLTFEYSLFAVYKWEAKYHKTFLNEKEKSSAELADFIKMMVIDGDPELVVSMNDNEIAEIINYMGDTQTAIVFPDEKPKPGQKDVMTNELIYYYMTALQIPFECQYWNLNHLLNLIHVASIKSESPKKMGKKATAARNNGLNKARRARLHTKG